MTVGENTTNGANSAPGDDEFLVSYNEALKET